jgi:hypothetical protein
MANSANYWACAPHRMQAQEGTICPRAMQMPYLGYFFALVRKLHLQSWLQRLQP